MCYLDLEEGIDFVQETLEKGWFKFDKKSKFLEIGKF